MRDKATERRAVGGCLILPVANGRVGGVRLRCRCILPKQSAQSKCALFLTLLCACACACGLLRAAAAVILSDQTAFACLVAGMCLPSLSSWQQTVQAPNFNLERTPCACSRPCSPFLHITLFCLLHLISKPYEGCFTERLKASTSLFSHSIVRLQSSHA